MNDKQEYKPDTEKHLRDLREALIDLTRDLRYKLIHVSHAGAETLKANYKTAKTHLIQALKTNTTVQDVINKLNKLTAKDENNH